MSDRPLAVVTGASTGIGYELAKCCAENGFDLVVAADEAKIKRSCQGFSKLSERRSTPVEVDLATMQGVDKLMPAQWEGAR